MTTAPAIFTRQAHSFEAQELQQTAALIFYEALAKGERLTLADALKKARSKVRNFMRNCSKLSELQHDALELVADDEAARPVPIVGKRQRQRETTEIVAQTLGVSTRHARRVIAAQKKKASGQADFFGGVAA